MGVRRCCCSRQTRRQRRRRGAGRRRARARLSGVAARGAWLAAPLRGELVGELFDRDPGGLRERVERERAGVDLAVEDRVVGDLREPLRTGLAGDPGDPLDRPVRPRGCRVQRERDRLGRVLVGEEREQPADLVDVGLLRGRDREDLVGLLQAPAGDRVAAAEARRRAAGPAARSDRSAVRARARRPSARDRSARSARRRWGRAIVARRREGSPGTARAAPRSRSARARCRRRGACPHAARLAAPRSARCPTQGRRPARAPRP